MFLGETLLTEVTESKFLKIEPECEAISQRGDSFYSAGVKGLASHPASPGLNPEL